MGKCDGVTESLAYIQRLFYWNDVIDSGGGGVKCDGGFIKSDGYFYPLPDSIKSSHKQGKILFVI